MMEVRVILETLTKRYPGRALAPDWAYAPVCSLQFRGPATLVVDLGTTS